MWFKSFLVLGWKYLKLFSEYFVNFGTSNFLKANILHKNQSSTERVASTDKCNVKVGSTNLQWPLFSIDQYNKTYIDLTFSLK